jgi:uncharacterized membrane protein YkvA (DUF1232 family)
VGGEPAHARRRGGRGEPDPGGKADPTPIPACGDQRRHRDAHEVGQGDRPTERNAPKAAARPGRAIPEAFGRVSQAPDRARPGNDNRSVVPADRANVPAAEARRKTSLSRRPLDGRKVMVRFVALATRLPTYLKLGWLLARDPGVPVRGKAALVGALGYVISPIDPVPGIIPVIGQLDDLAVLLLALRGALAAAPDDVAQRHLATVDLSHETLDRDLLALRATAVWIAGRGVALAALAARSVAGAFTRRAAP